MSKTDQKKLTLKSTFQDLKRLEPFQKKIKKWANIDDEKFGQVRLAVNEAVTNAIVHGNKENPDKKVGIIASKQEKKLQVSIQDEGKGFDPDSIKNPTKVNKLLDDSGRGVFLIKEYADEVQFLKGGTQLVMSFELSEN
jgi:serine/threonine-protein kinase RsbW